MSAKRTVVGDRWSVASKHQAIPVRRPGRAAAFISSPLHPFTRSSNSPAAAQRRGVLLLVILSLLILFVMIAVTYVLVATRQLQTARKYGQVGQTGDPPQQQLWGAAMQVVVGAPGDGTTTSPIRSVIGPHSLLEHVYGPYTAVGKVDSVVADSTGGQVIEFKVKSTTDLTSANPNFLLSSAFRVEGYFDGCVITMTSGPAKGLTSRIVRYDASTPSVPIFHVLAFKGVSSITDAANPNPTFIINGRAFSGTGAGNSSVTRTPPVPPAETGLLDAKDVNGYEFALLPNPVTYTPTNSYQASTDFPKGVPFGGLGGCNVDYSTPDYQNMYMSWTVQQPGKTQVILPSFHRPDLINFWASHASVTDWNNNRDLLSKIMLRPNPLDHPNFTGSNSLLSGTSTSVNTGWQLAMTGRDATGNFISPWDIDNDGDGVRDSVWLDLGYPVQSTNDGRLYKPLFAILCVDLDGRLNLDTAGTTEQIPTGGNQQSTHARKFVGAGYSTAPTGNDLAYVPVPYAGTTNATPAFQMPRGEGLGPAEIMLYDPVNPSSTAKFPILQDLSTGRDDFTKLLRGATVNGRSYEGRYGDLKMTSTPEAGKPNSMTLQALVKRFSLPDKSFNPQTNTINPLSAYNSPTDLWGRMCVGLDHRGQPLYWKPQWAGETQNSPYDINLARDVANPGYAYGLHDSSTPSNSYGTLTDDNPFTAFELESILRPYDIDSSDLAPRLRSLLQNSLNSNPSLRNKITTESRDIPTPPAVAPTYLRDALQNLYGRKFATNIVELLAARIKKDNPALPGPQINNIVNKQGRLLLSPELIAGLRMNVNRPFGDGRDSDGNRVVDEPTVSELQKEGQNAATNTWAWLDPSLNGKLPNPLALDLVNGVDVNGNGKVDQTDQLLARQLYARHLYVLARLMLDDSDLQKVDWFPNESLNAAQKKEMAIRRIAQWAVNVVDAMDP